MATLTKPEKILQGMLYGIFVIAVFGVVFMFWNASLAGLILFDLLAFSVSIAALFLATLGAISNIQQTRITRKLLREMKETVAQINDIDHDNETIKRELHQDFKASQTILEVLDELGIGEKNARHSLASSIEEKLRLK